MKKNYLNKLLNTGIFTLFAIILYVIMYATMFGTQFPSYMFFDVLLILGSASVCFFFKSIKFDKIYLSIMMFIHVAFVLANVNYYKYFGDIFSLNNITLVGHGLSVIFDPSFYDFPFIFAIIAYYGVFITTLLLANKYIKTPSNLEEPLKHKRIRLSVSIVSFITLFSTYGGTLYALANGNPNVMLAKVSNFKKFGMNAYYTQELLQLLNPSNDNEQEVQEMKDYFSVPEDQSNKFTGLLKDYNVVTIMIETGDDLILNDAICPNLMSLLNDGINCSGNISKNKTVISEFIGLTGSAPITGIKDKRHYNLPYSVPSLLGDNYRKVFFHDAVTEGSDRRDFYNRKELIPKLGFDEYYFHEQMLSDLPAWDWDGSYTLDSITSRRVADIMLQDLSKPLYAFYTTLSMHGPYYNRSNREELRSMYGERYDAALALNPSINPLKGTINEEPVENFLLASMDFDEGLGYLINEFKEKGAYDNTLFVIYGDHECYYGGADGIPLNRSLTGHDKVNNYDMYKTILTVCNPTLAKKFKSEYGTLDYSKFTSTYNIAPTILDLLGIKYNPRFYIGKSLFSPQMKETQVFYSIELSAYFNDDYWTIDGATIDNTFNEEADQEAFFLETQRIMEKEGYLDKILVSDFFDNHNFADFQPK